MNNDAFDDEVLAEKLEKLNNSQQSIESVSRWCIFHRKRARQIVETWDRMFTCSQSDQCVCFLFLANDILQNSRRKGSEFVNEFWSILPSALKHVYENGEEYAKKTVSRLVDIWEERKVFGSRGQGLKNIMFGKGPSPLTVLDSRISNPVKIVKKDSHSIRVKLAVGGFPEKVLSAFHGVHEEHLNEEATLDKCSFAVTSVGRLEEEAQIFPSQGSEETVLVDELCKLENILHQCIKHLETIEASRTVLLSELRAALQDQEARHEVVCNQLHAARAKLEKTKDLRQRLYSPSVRGSTVNEQPIEVSRILELNSIQSRQPVDVPRIPESNSSHAHPPTISSQHIVSRPSACLSTSEESKRATVAAIAAKLAASSSSAQMLTSVLSSLVAEVDASKSGGLQVSGFASLPILSQDHKRPKVEKPVLIGESSSDIGSSFHVSTSQHQVDACGKLEKMNDLRQRLESPSVRGSTPVNEPIEVPRILELNSVHSRQPVDVPQIPEPNSSHAHPPAISPQHRVSQSSGCPSTSEESKRATVAALAAKLAASSSSAQMFTSVLSSLVAEEAASKCGGLQVSGFASLPFLSQDHKRPKLEKPMLIGESSSDIGSTSHVSTSQHQVVGNSALLGSTSMQAPLPPLPLMPPATQPGNQFVQSAGVVSFGFNGNSSYPPHPLSTISMGLQRPGLQPPLQMSQQQQHAGPVRYYRPPGIGFYGQSHQPTTPPVPRQ